MRSKIGRKKDIKIILGNDREKTKERKDGEYKQMTE